MEIILVSSGAVAFGRSLINDSGKYDTVAARQLLASTGQVHLINAFARFFAQHQTLCSQVLVTKEDFRDRLHYLHMKNCFEILLQRSEEHTSELQSLMRISYAVFCLKTQHKQQ